MFLGEGSFFEYVDKKRKQRENCQLRSSIEEQVNAFVKSQN